MSGHHRDLHVLTHSFPTRRSSDCITPSGSGGFVHDPDGITKEKIDWVKADKTHRGGGIEDYVGEYKGATFVPGKTPWGVACDVALPCATQNELNGEDARTLVANG